MGKKDKKDKKEKKEKKEEAEGEDEAGSVSDTEYGDCDLSACPNVLQIKSSGHHKCDGTYQRMSNPSRGRPSYQQQRRDGKKSMYLFWHKKNQWKISPHLGSTK